jgi:hypothetical protein
LRGNDRLPSDRIWLPLHVYKGGSFAYEDGPAIERNHLVRPQLISPRSNPYDLLHDLISVQNFVREHQHTWSAENTMQVCSLLRRLANDIEQGKLLPRPPKNRDVTQSLKRYTPRTHRPVI